MFMDPIRRWLATATLPVKVFMGISIISAVAVLNKTVIAPHLKRQKYREAEEWANMILEYEENQANNPNSGINTNNNISY